MALTRNGSALTLAQQLDVRRGLGVLIGGNDFAILGDSISAQNSVYAAPNASTTTTTALYNTGYMAWAKALLGQQITFDPQNNFGIGGDLLYPGTDSNGSHPGIVSRVASVIASGVGNVVFLGGHNNVTTAGSPIADIIAQYSDIVGQLRAAGIRVFVGTLVPVTGMNSAQYAKLHSVNQFIRQLARKTPGVYLADWWAYINDYSATSPQQKQYWSRYNDTLHPGVRSAYAMGYVLAKAIRAALGLPDASAVIGSQSDTIDTTNGPYAALTQNSAMKRTGTGTPVGNAGGATNCTATGEVADNFIVQKNGGSSTCTLTASIESPRTDLDGISNGYRQVVAFSTTQSGGGSEQINVRTNTVSAGSLYGAGDQLFAECTIELANPINCYGVWLEFTENHTVAYQIFYDLANDGTSGNQLNALMDNATRTYKYTLRTPIMTMNSNTQSFYAQVNILFNPSLSGGASAMVKVGDLAVRKVAA